MVTNEMSGHRSRAEEGDTVHRLGVLGSAVVVVVAVVALSGCVPKPVPIHVDGDTETTTSKAEWRVAAVSTSRGPGIEIRFRNCSTLLLTGGGFGSGTTAHLRPVAHVTDAKGTVIFSNGSPMSAVVPAGSQIIDTTTPTTDDLQRIIIPTSAASGALKIKPTCTSYPGYGSGPGFSWDFDSCTTTTRSCATRTAGDWTLRP